MGYSFLSLSLSVLTITDCNCNVVGNTIAKEARCRPIVCVLLSRSKCNTKNYARKYELLRWEIARCSNKKKQKKKKRKQLRVSTIWYVPEFWSKPWKINVWRRTFATIRAHGEAPFLRKRHCCALRFLFYTIYRYFDIYMLYSANAPFLRQAHERVKLMVFSGTRSQETKPGICHRAYFSRFGAKKRRYVKIRVARSVIRRKTSETIETREKETGRERKRACKRSKGMK